MRKLTALFASCNELTALTALNRFQQLRSLNVMGNALQIGGGMVLRLPRLQELDLSGNRLVAVPPLNELPQLQVLRLQRNQISRNWGELQSASQSLRELEAASRLWPAASMPRSVRMYCASS